jgi:hypothetical protein
MRAGLDRCELGTQIAFELPSRFFEPGVIATFPPELDAGEQVRPLGTFRGYVHVQVVVDFDGNDLGGR